MIGSSSAQAADAVGYAGSITMLQCLALLAHGSENSAGNSPKNSPGGADDLVGAFDGLVRRAAPLAALSAAFSCVYFARAISRVPYTPFIGATDDEP